MNSRARHSGICLLALPTLCGCLYFVDEMSTGDMHHTDLRQSDELRSDLLAPDVALDMCPTETRGISCWDFRQGKYESSYEGMWENKTMFLWSFPRAADMGPWPLRSPSIDGMKTSVVISPSIKITNRAVTGLHLRVAQDLRPGGSANAEIIASTSKTQQTYVFRRDTQHGAFEKTWIKGVEEDVRFQFSLTVDAGPSLPVGAWQIQKVEIIPLCNTTPCKFK